MFICKICTSSVADPGFPIRGGHGPIRGALDLQHGCFSAKMYVKMKELGPMGGVRPARPPRSANEVSIIKTGSTKQSAFH